MGRVLPRGWKTLGGVGAWQRAAIAFVVLQEGLTELLEALRSPVVPPALPLIAERGLSVCCLKA